MNMIGLRLLFATALVGSALSGCAFLSPFTSCKGTGPAVAELDELRRWNCTHRGPRPSTAARRTEPPAPTTAATPG
ncbi:hypothetical protein OG264_36410 [Streptomyces xanthophaeus]|uniref:hypothetical protein n=1 Tax=Streptomyces xanthophaeus TaxID=67385 RepID=UPI0038664569|nr:hypothetical protein OG264_36410 [Streptomyces xanthophaeus]WST58502.1 hypothetical protein OG605_02025 [Streptomyces xanthophaeus]